MSKIEELKAALVAASLGNVIPRRPLYDDVPDGYLESDLDFVENNFNEALNRIDGPTANFIALAHNLMPHLLQAADLLIKFNNCLKKDEEGLVVDQMLDLAKVLEGLK